MVELGAIQTTPGSRHDVGEPHMDAAHGSSRRHRIGALALAAGVAVTALVVGTEAQAHGNIISGGALQGDYWILGNDGAFAFQDAQGNNLPNGWGRPPRTDFESERQFFLDDVADIMSSPAHGTFNATIINYPNFSDTQTTNTQGLNAFLGRDFPGGNNPIDLSRSFYRFTGALNLQDGVTYDFRIYSDDGVALWWGDNAVNAGNGTPGVISAFNFKQGFANCCTPSIVGTGEPVPFELWYWEDRFNMGLRVDVSVTGTLENGGSFVPLGAPEINGSGFAYIAFILGSLGLWIYSGAGVGGLGSRPVRGQDPGSTGLRAAAA